MKKGISLIVLVITIIVIIILAGAVILSLSRNNPIAQATKAVYVQDKVAVQSAINMFLAAEMATNKATADVVAGTLGTGLGAGSASYSIGGGVAKEFIFGTGAGNVGISLPTYAGTTAWSIDSNAVVSLSVGGVAIY